MPPVVRTSSSFRMCPSAMAQQLAPLRFFCSPNHLSFCEFSGSCARVIFEAAQLPSVTATKHNDTAMWVGHTNFIKRRNMCPQPWHTVVSPNRTRDSCYGWSSGAAASSQTPPSLRARALFGKRGSRRYPRWGSFGGWGEHYHSEAAEPWPRSHHRAPKGNGGSEANAG